MDQGKIDALIAAIRARGNDATCLRDAVHEAHHAIESKVPDGQWDRETIHRYVTRMGRADAARSEIRARAVEQIVCARMGVDPGAVDHWAFVACMEAMKYRTPFFPMDVALSHIRRTMESPEAQTWADAVMALNIPAQKPIKRTRKAKVTA